MSGYFDNMSKMDFSADFTEDLRKYLSPVESSFSFDRDNMIERSDIKTPAAEFLKKESTKIVFIAGDAGTGKSVAAYLLSDDKEMIHAFHRCDYADSRTLSARTALGSLAFSLYKSSEDYKALLDVSTLKNTGESVNELFMKLFKAPLKGSDKKFVLLVDGLDEMGENEAKKLIDAIKNGKAQNNVKFIITVRSENQFEHFYKNKRAVIRLDQEQNREASKELIRQELEKRDAFSDATLEKILKASECNLLYISKLFEDIDENETEIDETIEFPQGIFEEYKSYMSRKFADVEKYEKNYASVIGLLCAVKHPITARELSELAEIKYTDFCNEILPNLSFLIKTEDDKISLFHRSVKDFLVSEAAIPYMVDASEWDEKIVSLARNLGLERIKQNGYLNDSLFYHIFKMKNSEFADELCCEDKEWSCNCSAASVQYFDDDEFQCSAETVENMENGYLFFDGTFAVLRPNRNFDFAQKLVNSIETSKRFGILALIGKGICLFNTDNISDAKKLFKEALAKAEKKSENEKSFEILRDLSLSYSWLGDVFYKENDIDTAKKYYSDSLEIAKQNAEKYQSYQSLRDLSISYDRMGDIALKEDDISTAKKYYSDSLEIIKQNAEKYPSYESLRDLSVSYNKMGDIALKEDDIKGAKQYYSDSLEIRKQNKEKYPSYESLRDLSVSYNRMGDVALKEDDIKGAKKYFSDFLEIAKQNAEKYPSYQSLRDLSVSWYKLAQVEKADKNFDKAKEYCEKAIDLAKRNLEKFPCEESKSDYDADMELLRLIEEEKKQ